VESQLGADALLWTGLGARFSARFPAALRNAVHGRSRVHAGNGMAVEVVLSLALAWLLKGGQEEICEAKSALLKCCQSMSIVDSFWLS